MLIALFERSIYLQSSRDREREREREREKPWGGLLAVIKLVSRRVHGHLRRTSSLSLTSKNMVLETGDQCLPTLVIN
jgi:hypothetical protein